jgi:hypothetical protein
MASKAPLLHPSSHLALPALRIRARCCGSQCREFKGNSWNCCNYKVPNYWLLILFVVCVGGAFGCRAKDTWFRLEGTSD